MNWIDMENFKNRFGNLNLNDSTIEALESHFYGGIAKVVKSLVFTIAGLIFLHAMFNLSFKFFAVWVAAQFGTDFLATVLEIVQVW